MTCETVGELLLDYMEGELPPHQASSVQAHLDQCRPCAAKCREIAGLLGDLGAARSVEPQASKPDQSRSKPTPPAALEEHARLGDFEILGELGRGGMGVVYRARQISLNRIVALKLLSVGLVQSERSVSRFEREAQAAARLHHTNIVPIYAQGREQDYFYYAMELIEGESLDKVLRRQRQAADDQTLKDDNHAALHATTHRLSTPANLLRSAVSTARLSRVMRSRRPPRDYKRIVRLVAGVAEGLHHAHEQGVVHRDIKPQNLLLGPDDQLHITDFGLARMLDEPGLTRSTEMVGTPAYMAPEQITGGKAAVDRRTDVYALGVTLYEMLTLRRPFQAETYDQTISQVLNRDPKPPRKLDPHIPPDLETICLRAMEKEPQRRFPSAAEMAGDLRRYAEGFPIASRRIGPLGKTVRWVRRHPWRASVIATTALLVIVIPLALSFFHRTGNAKIDDSFGILLNDYREKDRALKELTWISRLGGDRYRRDFVEAFAHIRTEPQESIELLKQLVAERPDDPDAHYLLAWAYARRISTQGVEMWGNARKHIDMADDLRNRGIQPTGAGWFFRGQAVWGSDPTEAERSFDQAIKRRTNFTQAMLHQCRAMNQIMYSLRDNSYYRKAVGRLESVTQVQPTKAYPRYLLAITHLLAAEIYLAEQKPEQAQRAYAASLDAARSAQSVEPSSPRGYAAEANYYESVEDFEAAIAAWRKLDHDQINKSPSDFSERCEYQMRLHFWLGEYAEAEQMRKGRYGALTGYSRERCFDGDDSFYEALIAASAGDRAAAEGALATGADLARQNAEYSLRLDAAYRLLGRPPPPDLLPQEIPAECNLSPGWTRKWLDVLVRYQRGEVAWGIVEQASRTSVQRPDDPRLRMAGAHFYRGVGALVAGQRQEALEAFRAARNQYDNENYCFRAELLLTKLRTDPDWPTWLRTNSSATP